MSGEEIDRVFARAHNSIDGFIAGFVSLSDFCDKLETILEPLKRAGRPGVRGIWASYHSPGEKVRGVLHEVLHCLANWLCGIPSGGIGAIIDKSGDVWGYAIMDPYRARTVCNLKRKLAVVERLHQLIERLGI